MVQFRRNERKVKNLRKFRHAEFDYTQFVREYYVVDGEAYILVNVRSLDDIISRYSVPGHEWINEEFTSYLDDSASHIPVEESIVVAISGTRFTDAEKVTIRKVIRDHYGLELVERMLDLRNNAIRARSLLAVSIFFSVLLVVLHPYLQFVLFELIFVGLWFATWELANRGWLERSDLRAAKLEAGQLASMRVVFDDDADVAVTVPAMP